MLAFGRLLLVAGAGCVGCASLGIRTSSLVRADAFEIVLEDAVFDGHQLSGRILIGGASDRRLIDQDLWPINGFDVVTVVQCGSGKAIPLYSSSCAGRISGAEGTTKVWLDPSSWYGRTVALTLVPDSEPAEDCVVVDAILPLELGTRMDRDIRLSIRGENNGPVVLLHAVARGNPLE
jgi:hypothetical protein